MICIVSSAFGIFTVEIPVLVVHKVVVKRLVVPNVLNIARINHAAIRTNKIDFGIDGLQAGHLPNAPVKFNIGVYVDRS